MSIYGLSTTSRPSQLPLSGLGDTVQRLAFDATAGIASISFNSGEVNRYARNPASRTLVEGPVLRRPSYLAGMRSEKHVYSPIDAGPNFRLLKLWPSTKPKEECIRCSLVPCSIVDMAGKYDTLSYTWGSQAQDFPVFITDDKDEKKPRRAVPVTPHLYDALLQLRKTYEPTFLWIDQLCIDQSSNDEKGSQVALMADIYRSSRRTVVWLGSCNPLDMVFLQDLFSAVTKNKFTSAEGDAQLLAGLLPATSMVRPPSIKADQRQGALTRLLNRSWFTRAWIFQEVVLSSEVMMRIGRLAIQLGNLIRLAEAVCAEEVKVGGYANSIIMSTVGYDALFLIKHKRGCGSADCMHDRQLNGSFLGLLVQTLHQFRATDPRDYLYAYLAFQDKHASLAIRPNYGISPAAVWIDATRNLIRQSSSLDVFAAARGDLKLAGDGGKGFGGGLPSSDELPSWVPYWSEVFPYARPIYAPDFDSKFDSCRGMPHEWMDGDSEGELVAQGSELSTVLWWSPHNFAMTYHRNAAGGTKAVLALETQLAAAERHLGLRSDGVQQKFKEHYPDAKVAFMRTLLADGAFGDQDPMSDAEIRDFMDIADREATIQENEDRAVQDPATRTEAHQAQYLRLEKLRDWALIVQQKRIVVTTSGHIALGSSAVRVGDRIWMLRGSKTPCVLREDAASGRLRLVGQCYVEGLMYGKTFQKELEDKVVII